MDIHGNRNQNGCCSATLIQVIIKIYSVLPVTMIHNFTKFDEKSAENFSHNPVYRHRNTRTPD